MAERKALPLRTCAPCRACCPEESIPFSASLTNLQLAILWALVSTRRSQSLNGTCLTIVTVRYWTLSARLMVIHFPEPKPFTLL